MRQQEKMIQDMEKSVVRREVIITRWVNISRREISYKMFTVLNLKPINEHFRALSKNRWTSGGYRKTCNRRPARENMPTGDPVGGKCGKTCQPATQWEKCNGWQAQENMLTSDERGKIYNQYRPHINHFGGPSLRLLTNYPGIPGILVQMYMVRQLWLNRLENFRKKRNVLKGFQPRYRRNIREWKMLLPFGIILGHFRGRTHPSLFR